jgi:hypothetical protein
MYSLPLMHNQQQMHQLHRTATQVRDIRSKQPPVATANLRYTSPSSLASFAAKFKLLSLSPQHVENL